MAKELILMQDVPGLGIEGDLVKVADGYARNFLLPRKLAAPITTLARRQLEMRRAAREERLKTDLERASSLAARLAGLTVTIRMKASEGGKLYGSVHAEDIIKALAKHGLEIDRSAVRPGRDLDAVGEHEVPVKLHPQITASVKLLIEEE